MQYRVDIIKTEIGWGSKIDETVYFDQLDEAEKFVSRFNSVNRYYNSSGFRMFAEKPLKSQKY